MERRPFNGLDTGRRVRDVQGLHQLGRHLGGAGQGGGRQIADVVGLKRVELYNTDAVVGVGIRPEFCMEICVEF